MGREKNKDEQKYSPTFFWMTQLRGEQCYTLNQQHLLAYSCPVLDLHQRLV